MEIKYLLLNTVVYCEMLNSSGCSSLVWSISVAQLERLSCFVSGEVRAMLYLDNVLVGETAWKSVSQQCWDQRFNLDLERVGETLFRDSLHHLFNKFVASLYAAMTRATLISWMIDET